ncbi:MAG: type IV pilin [Halapricum sp.]
MKLKQFFTDDDAVSPVIGVILMVAITVILAAVIASFVLGLGQSAGNNAPTASFSWNYQEASGGDNALTITLQNGNLNAGEISVKGTFEKSGSTLTHPWTDGPAKKASDLTAGDQITFKQSGTGDAVSQPVDGGYDLRVVWTPSEGGDSSTLAHKKGPDA